jgi:hypothetical protein
MILPVEPRDLIGSSGKDLTFCGKLNNVELRLFAIETPDMRQLWK